MDGEQAQERTPLISASQWGYLAAVRQLIEARADVNAKDKVLAKAATYAQVLHMLGFEEP